jgi:hypothetical protein
MMVDLTSTDLYPDGLVPDGDLRTCLRVLRTLRAACAHGPHFRPREALIISHAHLTVVRLAESGGAGLKAVGTAAVKGSERKEQGNADDQPTEAPDAPPGYDPDLAC